MSDDVFTVDGYQLTNCIASGNASEIWEVADQGNQPLCMKLLLPTALENPAAKQVLKHEAKVAKALDHPNIIKVHKVVVTKKHGYILMDYFRAPNIKNQITGDLVGLHARFRKVFESVCLALGYVHEKGWVHRDIKPENILANKVGELRLIDFSLAVRAAGGLGKLLGARSKAVQGTRTYIAPETLLKKSPTIQTDMYSLGITVFEMLTGNPPFRGMSPGDLLRMHVQEKAAPVSHYNKNITPEMDRLVARLLEKKPDKRHKTMEEVYAEFRSLQVFKEDPKDIESRRQDARKESEMSALGASERINSRRDHLRSEAGLNVPAQPAPPKPASPQPKPAPANQPVSGGTAQPPAGQPVAGQGYGPPGAPNAPYPNYPPPGYGFPPGMQPPPGYGFPPGMQPPPGYQPQYAPQPMPNQQPAPQSPNPQPSPQQARQPAPPQQPPASQQPPKPTAPPKPEPKPTKKPEEDDLPLMEIDDLPDVL